MQSILLLICSVLLFVHPSNADEAIFGSWQEAQSGERLDVLDGFKPGTGPILILDKKGEVSVSTWTSKNTSYQIKLGYRTYDVATEPNGNLHLSVGGGKPRVFSKISAAEEGQAVSIKNDRNGFLSKLQNYEWLTSIDGSLGLFNTTFSPESGVLQLIKDKKLKDLMPWGVASDVIKIGRTVIIEARVSDKYFVGLDQRDKFVVFRSVKKAPKQTSTNLEKQREQFFDALMSGAWETKTYGGSYIHKFRPIFGELSGVKLSTKDDRLSSDAKWEYSPSTGAIKVGSASYVGALVVNNTLAFVKKNGDQEFYYRFPEQEMKRFTLGDVKTTALNENSLKKIRDMLTPQFQRGDFLYQFEFKNDIRNGFVHQWKSNPFVITGETFNSTSVGKSKELSQVEDFIIFDNGRVFKMDASASRLRPKSDAEASQDAFKQEQIQSVAQTKKILIRVSTADGKTQDLPIPVSGFGDITGISIIAE
jgi:hypothetical protein